MTQTPDTAHHLAHPPAKIPRVRIDALTDGIFAVAMTLLVLDIRFPESFQPVGSAALLHGLAELWPKLLAYVISFMILGLRWLGLAQVPTHTEYLGSSYIRWWLLYLMMITLLPFSTALLGNHASLAPAIWLYCANTALIAVASWRMLVLTPGVEDPAHLRQRQVSLLVLLASAVVGAAVACVSPHLALLAFFINMAAALFGRLRLRAA